jgi:pimeloyl-ACP methyl ester carboxylesterase
VTQLSTSRIPGGFTEKTARVNGVTLNYATGGTGPAVVLLHGYPQTWYMWRKVMPALAEQYTVIAPDLRGSGGSDAPATGYDKASLAEDIHQLLLALGHADEVSLVGHDIGGTVSYAYAAAHRDSVRRLTVIESPQIDESLYQFPSVTPAGPGFWNFGFFMLDNGLPERIVSRREDTWIAGFVDWLEVVKGAVDPDAVAEYAAHLRRPGHLGASYAYFRTFHGDAEATIRHRETPLAMPVLAIGGESAVNSRYLLSVLVDGPAEDPGQARRRSTGNGGDERVAAKPEELVSLGRHDIRCCHRWSPESRDTGCRLGVPR